jgi:hypothetical protein
MPIITNKKVKELFVSENLSMNDREGYIMNSRVCLHSVIFRAMVCFAFGSYAQKKM